MPKIIVVIENTEDGQPIWEEAIVKQLHDTIRPGTKPNHHDGRKNYGDELPHYSCHQHKTDNSKQSSYSFAGTATPTTAEEVDSDRDETSTDSGKYRLEA